MPRPPRTRRERGYRATLIATLALGLLVAGPALFMRLATAGDTHGPGGTPRPADAGIVLGARVYPDGTPSPHLRERVETAVDLYERGLVSRLLMSGDGDSADGWSEPQVMRDLAVQAGVPADAILLDEAGVDTFATCARAAELYGVESAILVSQEFHVPRATWLCRQHGVDAQAVHTQPYLGKGHVVGNIRELGAAWKALLNVWGGREA